MKKLHLSILFFALVFLGFAKSSFAQGNLQFNQVLLFDIAGAGTQAITVPPGKVWKIESVSLGSPSSTPSLTLRNSSGVSIGFFSSVGNSNSAAYPFWLPSGFSGSFLNNYSTTRCCVSIIEFNVVP